MLPLLVKLQIVDFNHSFLMVLFLFKSEPDDDHSVHILRDTGCSQSVILADALRFLNILIVVIILF